jgi:hypothetical protein
VANYFLSCPVFMANMPEKMQLYLTLAKIDVISPLVNYNLRNKSIMFTLVISVFTAY